MISGVKAFASNIINDIIMQSEKQEQSACVKNIGNTSSAVKPQPRRQAAVRCCAALAVTYGRTPYVK